MIDKNKIAKAARKCLAAFRKANPDGYSSSNIDIESNCLKNFKDGAKWAINEFLKDLWHDVDEIPKRAKAFIFECGDYSMNYHVGMMFNPNDYKKNAEIWHMNRWCYLEDILPKQEGGEQ